MMVAATHCVVSAVLIVALLLINPSPGTAVLIPSGAVALGRHSYGEWLKADREAKERLPTT